jgi:hypothetical protein
MSIHPQGLDDSVFDHLHWDANLECYSGRIVVAQGDEIKVSVTGEGADWVKAIEKARTQFIALKKELPRIYDAVRAEFLPLYNESWSEGVNGLGEPVGHGIIDSEEFDSLVNIESIWFEPDESITLYFSDTGVLFHGHAIRISVDSQFNIRSSGLET